MLGYMRGACGLICGNRDYINFYIICLLIEIPIEIIVRIIIEIPSDTGNDQIIDTATAYGKANLPRIDAKGRCFI